MVLQPSTNQHTNTTTPPPQANHTSLCSQATNEEQSDVILPPLGFDQSAFLPIEELMRVRSPLPHGQEEIKREKEILSLTQPLSDTPSQLANWRILMNTSTTHQPEANQVNIHIPPVSTDCRSQPYSIVAPYPHNYSSVPPTTNEEQANAMTNQSQVDVMPLPTSNENQNSDMSFQPPYKYFTQPVTHLHLTSQPVATEQQVNNISNQPVLYTTPIPAPPFANRQQQPNMILPPPPFHMLPSEGLIHAMQFPVHLPIPPMNPMQNTSRFPMPSQWWTNPILPPQQFPLPPQWQMNPMAPLAHHLMPPPEEQIHPMLHLLRYPMPPPEGQMNPMERTPHHRIPPTEGHIKPIVPIPRYPMPPPEGNMDPMLFSHSSYSDAPETTTEGQMYTMPTINHESHMYPSVPSQPPAQITHPPTSVPLPDSNNQSFSAQNQLPSHQTEKWTTGIINGLKARHQRSQLVGVY